MTVDLHSLRIHVSRTRFVTEEAPALLAAMMGRFMTTYAKPTQDTLSQRSMVMMMMRLAGAAMAMSTVTTVTVILVYSREFCDQVFFWHRMNAHGAGCGGSSEKNGENDLRLHNHRWHTAAGD